jgi:hypothetical protein
MSHVHAPPAVLLTCSPSLGSSAVSTCLLSLGFAIFLAGLVALYEVMWKVFLLSG